MAATSPVFQPDQFEPTSPLPTGEGVGESIDDFHLLEELGGGGFGVVFLAERRAEVVQRVALKVIRPGMDSRAILARFEQERQALAGLHHPNIATLIHAGTTRTGRPYFAMELVQGKPLTEHAWKSGASLEDRLALFVHVCEGADHAHDAGLIHRDLKPANVLVAEVSGRGVPKIIDFGIAKALSGPLTDKTLVTRAGSSIGTPAYMSPEQAEGSPRVDRRSDVYSLGVMLYELVLGRLPYDDVPSREGPVPAWRVTPDATPRNPQSISPELPTDVVTVLLRAIERDPERRYATARALADDLRRLLAGLPPLARRDSALHVVRSRTRRMVARHHVAALLVAWALVTPAAFVGLHQVFFKRTSLAGWWQAVVAKLPAPAPPPGREGLRDVVVIRTNDDATDAELVAAAGLGEAALAAESLPPGWTGPVPPTYTLRLAHGELMKRLARSRPRAVLWDFFFTSDARPAQNAALVEGFASLGREGVPFVAGMRGWCVEEKSRVATMSAILSTPGARLGPSNAAVHEGIYEGVHLALRRLEDGAILPASVIEVLAAVTQPGAQARVVLSDGNASLRVLFYESPSGASASTMPIGRPQTIRLTSVSPVGRKDSDPRNCVNEGDQIALLAPTIPDAASLARVTVPYQRALALGDAELAELVRGKVVVVGPGRAEEDLVTFRDGRRVHGMYLLAATIQHLLDGAPPPLGLLSERAEWTLAAFAGSLGLVIGLRACARPGRRAVLYLLAMAAIVAGALAAAWLGGLFLNPTVMLGTVPLLGEVGALIGRARARAPTYSYRPELTP